MKVTRMTVEGTKGCRQSVNGRWHDGEIPIQSFRAALVHPVGCLWRFCCFGMGGLGGRCRARKCRCHRRTRDAG